MQAVMETIFDVIYLTTVISLGIIMIRKSRGRMQYKVFGIMAVILGAGDSFHLIPRAVALCTTGLEHYTQALGIGKLVTSITMTIFYILLYHIWRHADDTKDMCLCMDSPDWFFGYEKLIPSFAYATLNMTVICL